MSLSYDQTVVKTETQVKEVEVYKHWSCYTSQANNTLHQKAKRFIAKMEKMKAEDASYKKYVNAFGAFVRSYRKFQSSQTGSLGGAGDTAVREVVWSFLVEVAKAVDFDTDTLDRVWDENYD